MYSAIAELSSSSILIYFNNDPGLIGCAREQTLFVYQFRSVRTRCAVRTAHTGEVSNYYQRELHTVLG